MVRLTRQEMWEAICKKYPSLKEFCINKDGYNGQYISRPKIMSIFWEMKIYKSKHITNEQKQRIKFELAKEL